MNNEIIEGFKAVEYMRRERDLISRDIQDMNHADLQKYFERRRAHRPVTGKLIRQKGDKTCPLTA